jgi:dienelactone hydrolase
MSKYQKEILCGVFLLMFLGSVFSLSAIYPNVDEKINQFTKTSDGVDICFDVFEPKQSAQSIKTGIIMGHGVAVNKEVYKIIAKELASIGFVVVTFDFRSHGRSAGNFNFRLSGGQPEGFNFLVNDVLAAKSYLAGRGDINMSNLGYMGYSMGGGVGFELLQNDYDFRAFVGLAPVPDFQRTNSTRPPNLLILIGQFDEAIDFDSVYKVMQNRTGLDRTQLEMGKIYGNFEDGTASKLVVDKGTEHFFAPYYEPFVLETRNWFYRALLGPNMPDISAQPLIGIHSTISLTLLSGLVGIILIGLFSFVLINITSKIAKNEQLFVVKEQVQLRPLNPKDQKILLGTTVFLGYLGLLPSLVLFILPFIFANVILLFFSGLAVAMYILLKKHGKKNGYEFKAELKKTLKSGNWQLIALSIVIGLFAYGVLATSIGYLLGIVPHISELPWIFAYGIVIFAIFFMFNVTTEKMRQSIDPEKSIKLETFQTKQMIKDYFISAGLISIFISAMILLISLAISNMFLAMILILAIPLILFVSLISKLLKYQTGSLAAGAVFTGTVLSLIVITASPALNIFALLF